MGWVRLYICVAAASLHTARPRKLTFALLCPGGRCLGRSSVVLTLNLNPEPWPPATGARQAAGDPLTGSGRLLQAAGMGPAQTGAGMQRSIVSSTRQGALVANYPWDAPDTGQTGYAKSPDDATFRLGMPSEQESGCCSSVLRSARHSLRDTPSEQHPACFPNPLCETCSWAQTLQALALDIRRSSVVLWLVGLACDRSTTAGSWQRHTQTAHAGMAAAVEFAEMQRATPVGRVKRHTSKVRCRFLAETYANAHAGMAAAAEFAETQGITNGAAWYPVHGGMQVGEMRKGGGGSMPETCDLLGT